MASNLNILANLKLVLGKDALKTQLATIKREIENKLSVDVNLKIKGVEQAKKAIKDATTLKDNTKTIKNETASIDKLIARYKTMKISYEELDKYGRRIIESERFKTKSLSEQAKVYDKLNAVEKQRRNNLAETEKINRRLQNPTNPKTDSGRSVKTESQLIDEAHGKALEMNRKLDAAKVASMNKLHSQALGMNAKFESDRLKQSQTAMDKLHQEALRMNRSLDSSRKRSDQEKQASMKSLHTEALRMNRELDSERRRVASLNTNQQSTSVRIFDPMQTQSVQTSMQGRAQGLQSRIGTVERSGVIDPQQIALVNEQYAQLESRIGRITNNRMAQQWTRDYTALNNQVRTMNQTIEEGSRGWRGYTNNIGATIAKFGLWMVTATAVMAPIRGIQYMVKSLIEMEDALVSISRVMEDANFKMNEFGNSMLNLAKSTGSTFKQTADVSLRFAQAGYNMNETLGLTKTALMAVQTAELDATKATESMIGIMSQWSLSASDMPLLLDKINKISDEYTVTSEDLVQGLLRSSAAAKNLGISLDETISLLTIMIETSGRTGKEVGSALNSVLSYATRGNTLDVLESSGIQVFTDKSKTQFRNFMDVFEDISKSWGTLSTEVQDGFVKSADEAQLFNSELAETVGLQQEWSDVQRRDVSNATAGKPVICPIM